jgi:uncharacterized protein
MFEGYLASFTPPKYAGFNIVFPIDSVFQTIIQNLFVGKFYAIFSMLFGLSFYLILDRKKDSSALKFAWRLVLLFLIGFIHHIHYRGDFLTVYAVFGLALIPFRKLPTRLILLLGLFFALNGPSILIKTISLMQPPVQLSQPIAMSPNPIEMATNYFQLIINGDYQKILVSNSTIGFINKYNYLKFSGRLWVIPGLFLLGLWVGRKKWHENIEKIPLRKLMIATAFIGIPLVFINFYFSMSSNSEILRYFGSIAKDASNIFMPLLYICLVLYFYKTNSTQKLVKQFIPVGKMGLTTYVSQSAFGIFIFYGYGLGLLLKLSGTAALLLGILFFISQVFFSKWWFSNYKYGPLEWLWRSGTHRSWQSITISKPTMNTN